MSVLTPLITEAEADAVLNATVYPEWAALDSAEKNQHIMNASVYTRKTWECADEDFETPDLSDDAKVAVAYYSEADRAGNLYGSVSAEAGTATGSAGGLTKLTVKAGSVEKTEEWADKGAGGAAKSPVESPLSMADDIFLLLGCSMTRSRGAVSLGRN